MPACRVPTLRADELPDVATVAEIAAFARVDPRTLRAEILAGNVPGAFRVGASHRVLVSEYLSALGRGCHDPRRM